MDDNTNAFGETDFDKLTGNAGRLDLIGQLQQACKKDRGVLILINLDNFEIFNDVYGYDIGEQLLYKCIEIINANTEDDDIKGRLGGDEFIVFIKGVTDRVSFTRLYKKINDQITESAKKLVGEDMRISLGISIGVVFVPDHGDVYEDLFQKANLTLEHVKQQGGQGCAFYSNGDGRDEKLILDNFELISKDLDETVEDAGALWVDYDHFSIIYRFMKRYLATYGGTAAKMLITITPLTSMSRDDFGMMTRELGKIINKTLRKSDLMMQSRQNQFFLFLPEVKDGTMERVSSRIMESWQKTMYYKDSEIYFDAEFISKTK